MVRALNLTQVRQFSWELENWLVGVHVSEFEEINAFLGENLGHSPNVSIRAPMLVHNYVEVITEGVLRVSDNTDYTKVWSSSLGKANRNLKLLELGVVL